MFPQYIHTKFSYLCLFFAYTLFGQNAPEDVVYNSSINQNLNTPTRIAIDNNDNIYIVDSHLSTINKYNTSGSLLKSYLLENLQPTCIAVNSSNQIYFGSKINGNIYRLHEDGSTSLIYNGLEVPVDMTFSPDNHLYVSDGKLRIVIKLDTAGKLIQTISNNSLLSPSSLIYDARKNRLLVAEAGIVSYSDYSPNPCKVHVFNLDGTYKTSFGNSSAFDPLGNGKLSRIQGLSLGKNNNIYVSDPYQGFISVFDENLVYKTRFGVYGSESGQLNVPLDIEYDSSGRILVSSMNNKSLEVYSITENLPTSTISNSDQTLCFGTPSAQIPINFTGTAPWTFTYRHNGIAQTPITTSTNPYLLEATEAGVYDVVALTDGTLAVGNSFTGAATITKHAEAITSLIQNADAVLCEGSTSNIEVWFTGTGPWTFSYTIDGLNPQEITTSSNPYALQVSQAGLYEISHIETGGCVGTSTGSATIIVNSKPTVQILNQNDEIKIFPGENYGLQLQFTGTGPWTFTYTVNELNPTIVTTSEASFTLNVSEAGTYEIISFSDAYCESTLTNDYPEILHFTIEKPFSLSSCENSKTYNLDQIAVDLFGVGNAVEWYTDDSFSEKITNTNSFVSNPTTIYALTWIYDSYHKSYAAVPLISNPLPVIIINPSNQIVCKGESLTLTASGALTYSWDNGVENGVSFIPDVTKQYTVVATDVNGCSTTASIIIDVDTTCNTLSINDYVKSKSEKDLFIVFPNPSNGAFSLKIKTPVEFDASIKITVVNVSAQVVASKVIKSADIDFSAPYLYQSFQLNHLRKGVYFVNVSIGNHVQTEKLIITD